MTVPSVFRAIGMALVATPGVALAQQWAGSPGTTGDSYRTGRVGIGTTAPQDLLHLYRPSLSTAGVLMGNGHTGFGRRGFLVDYHGRNGAELWNFQNTDMWFGTNNRRRMTIENTGRVGMGTANPMEELHLFRNERSSVGLLMGNSFTGAGRNGLFINYHGDDGAEFWNFRNSDMWFGTNDARRVTIRRDGRVGIGTTSPPFPRGNVGTGFGSRNQSFRLDVEGMLRVQHVEVWDGPGQFDLTWARGCHDNSAGQVCGLFERTRIVTRESSSKRYKKNIKPAPREDVFRILKLEAKQYEMKEQHGPPGWSTVGYVAEDVHESGMTDLVIYDENGRPDGVKYKKVAIYVNEVVKSQQQTIDQLTAQIAVLTKRVDELSQAKPQRSLIK